MFMSLGGENHGDSSDDESSKGGVAKLSRALIAQKEQGLRAIQIFKKFPHYMTGRMTKHDLEGGLKKLRRGFDNAEVLEIVGMLRMEVLEEDSSDESEIRPALPPSKADALPASKAGARKGKEKKEAAAQPVVEAKKKMRVSNTVYVSSQKLCDFAFGLSAMPWKAEKNRLRYKPGREGSFRLGEKEMEEKDEDEEGQDESGVMEEEDLKKVDLFAQPPKLIGSDTKLFWKTNSNVELSYYSNGLVVSVVGWDNGEHRLFTPLHLSESEVRSGILLKDVERATMYDAGYGSGGESGSEGEVTGGVERLESIPDGMKAFMNGQGGTQGKGGTAGRGQQGRPGAPATPQEQGGEGEGTVVKKIRYMEFLTMRLTLRRGKGGELDMGMTKLSDDGFDAGEWIIREVPPTYSPGSDLVRNGLVSFSDFESVHASLEAEKSLASAVSKEAGRKANQVRATMEAFEGLYKCIDKSGEVGWSRYKTLWRHAYKDVRRELQYEKFVNEVERMYPGWMRETYGKEFVDQFRVGKNGEWDLKRL
ncbi:hypothetical protein TrRE_jg13617 [Triparma retinervis]|uniref:Uncharacterized protein n=1 Tax=Triparma retinervis TaxID=2557542 RepID=A0A9W6ZHW8_9STRA|nr:hypothetical protein TrRE_jg13617 [Triparma retinervis]